jgi:hypothetical protein
MGRKVKKGGDYRPSVAVSRAAKDALAVWIEENDKPSQELVVSKLLKWFVGQPPVVQQVVRGVAPAEVVPAYAAALRAMADQISRSTPAGDPPGVVPLIDAAGVPVPPVPPGNDSPLPASSPEKREMK